MNSFILYFWIIILSPFIIRNRFIKLNRTNRNLIFFLSVYPIFLPLYFFDRIYGKISFAFNVFIVIGNSIQYENWAMEITYSYYLFIIFPNVFYLSSIFFKISKIILFTNSVVCILLILFGFLFNFTLLGQSTTFEYLFFNPYFIVLVLTVLILIRFTFVKLNLKEKQETEEWEEMIEQ